MPLRAPNAIELVMLAVVGIGAYAVYRLSKATPGGSIDPALVPPAQPLPAGLNVPNRIVNGAIAVARGTPVRGRFESADPGRTATALQQRGFQNVRVYTLADVQANPDLIAFPDALLAAGPGSRWFTASWMGDGTMSRATVQLPPEVVLLWYTASEPALRYRPLALAAGFGYAG